MKKCGTEKPVEKRSYFLSRLSLLSKYSSEAPKSLKVAPAPRQSFISIRQDSSMCRHLCDFQVSAYALTIAWNKPLVKECLIISMLNDIWSTTHTAKTKSNTPEAYKQIKKLILNQLSIFLKRVARQSSGLYLNVDFSKSRLSNQISGFLVKRAGSLDW